MKTKTVCKIIILHFLLHQISVCEIVSSNAGKLEIEIPGAKPDQPETYLCTPFKLDRDATQFITAFEPKADKATAHHMLLFGCKTPGKRDPIFNCGAMAAKQRGLSSSINPCGLGTAVLYACAQNAPKLHLPKDVAFRVGGPDSGIDWLVLQVNPLLLLVTSYKGKVPFSKTFYRKIIYCW